MNLVSVYILLCFLFASGCAGGRQVDTLLDSERAFAALSLDRGTRAAFLSFLDDSAVIFRPHPVNGKEWFGKQPSRPTVLAWEPEFADCSAGGDLGYTTGPWRLYATSHGEPVASGYFVSVWRRRPGGEWKVMLDVGTSTPLSLRGVKSVRTGSLSRTSGGSLAESRDNFLETEEELRKGVESAGLLEAYRHGAAPECRFYREGHVPAVGFEEARPVIAKGSGIARLTLLGIQKSRLSDLAYAYGRYEFFRGTEPGESGYYLHIWQSTQEGIRLVLDLLSPLPPQ